MKENFGVCIHYCEHKNLFILVSPTQHNVSYMQNNFAKYIRKAKEDLVVDLSECSKPKKRNLLV